MDENRLQEQGAKLVNIHVHHCLSYLMGELLKAPEFTCKAFGIDETTFYNMSAIPHYDETLKHWIEGLDIEKQLEVYNFIKAELDVELNFGTFSFELHELTEEQQEQLAREYNLDPDYYDVYEYWAISDWLAERFSERGELVVELADFNVWCRCTTGQAIFLDGVVRNLIKELGW